MGYDPVCEGKSMQGMIDLAQKGFFPLEWLQLHIPRRMG